METLAIRSCPVVSFVNVESSSEGDVSGTVTAVGVGVGAGVGIAVGVGAGVGVGSEPQAAASEKSQGDRGSPPYRKKPSQ